MLTLSAGLAPGRRAFQLAAQWALLEHAADLDALTAAPVLSSDESRALARIGLANYFAGAVMLPYRPFLADAERLGYDVGLLSDRFGVSIETVCHRLSTLQRPGEAGVPFVFVRVDRAGNVSKRHSATDFHFSRIGGTCPLWNVYEAFSAPGRFLAQMASMPDGRAYLWIAHAIGRRAGGYGSPGAEFALGLGCDARHAPRLVYARGLALDDPATAVPIGPGCRLCERAGCPQRAFPRGGRVPAVVDADAAGACWSPRRARRRRSAIELVGHPAGGVACGRAAVLHLEDPVALGEGRRQPAQPAAWKSMAPVAPCRSTSGSRGPLVVVHADVVDLGVRHRRAPFGGGQAAAGTGSPPARREAAVRAQKLVSRAAYSAGCVA